MLRQQSLLLFLALPCFLPAQDYKSEAYVDVGSIFTDDFTIGYQQNQEDYFYGADLSVISGTFQLLDDRRPSGFFITVFFGDRSILRDRNTSLYLKYTRAFFNVRDNDTDTEIKYRSDALMIMLSEELWSTDHFFFRAETGIGIMPTRWFSDDGSDLKRRGYHYDFWQTGGVAVSAKFKFGVKF